jgi:multidrug efflux pump subunit AcrA (membrane-fusion protein)
LGLLVHPQKNRLKVFVLQEDAKKITLNQNILSENGDTLGYVSALSPIVDGKNQSVSVWANLLNDVSVMHGQQISCRILISNAKAAIRVPRSAVLERDNRHVVFKLNKGKVAWVYVSTIATNKDWAVVNGKGLAKGDTIAVDQHFTLSHLQKVIPIVK